MLLVCNASPMNVATSDREATLRSWLDESLSFGALESRHNELDELVAACEEVGLELEALAELDGPIAQARAEAATDEERASKRPRPAAEEQEASGLLIDVDGAEPEVAAALASCVGRYCAIFEAHVLALRHFEAARALRPDSAAAALGAAQALLARGEASVAAECALSFWSSPARCGWVGVPGAPGSEEGAPGSEEDAARHLAFVLSALVDRLGMGAPPDALAVLAALTPLVHTPASAAVGALYAAWLP
eukprot:2145184-Prymnesium_polylepis.1